MESSSIVKDLLSVFFPEEITLHFEIKEVEEKKGYIQIHFEELPELVPSTMENSKEVVLDGFCNPIELQSFPLKGKPTFIKLFRRRWKRRGDRKHYANSYDFAQS